MTAKASNAGILGTGFYVPEKIITNFDLEKMVDTSDAWIVERTGVHERRVAEDNVPMSDLAFKAAEMALKDAGVAAEELDLIIVATLTSDRIIPSTACILQDRLGAGHAAAFDLSAACSGFTYAASIVWSSPNYDYMIVDGEKYLPTNTEGNSTFEIPVSALDTALDVTADTVAMSTPHEIEYTLTFDSASLKAND